MLSLRGVPIYRADVAVSNQFLSFPLSFYTFRLLSTVFNFSWVFALFDSRYLVYPSLMSSAAEFGIKPDFHYFSQ